MVTGEQPAPAPTPEPTALEKAEATWKLAIEAASRIITVTPSSINVVDLAQRILDESRR